jgi:Ca-activated chloride channel family protein
VDAFHFIRPLWLLALIPWLGLCYACLRRQAVPGNWSRVCDPALLPHILETVEPANRRLRAGLLALGGVLAIVALAGPAWKRAPQPTFRDESPLVIVLDLSASMYADDLSPDRISRVRFRLADLLRDRDAGRAGATALVVFAGDAFTVTPLTDDTDTILAMLPALAPDLMPVPGSRPDLGIRKALELLESGTAPGNVLLISDDAGDERDIDAAETLRTKGHRLSVLAVGTASGAPVPLPDGSGFLRDGNGRVIVPRMNPAGMRGLADRGDGMFVAMTTEGLELQTLSEYLRGSGSPLDAAAMERETDAWQDEGPWLILILLPLAALMFRRGYLLLIFVMVAPVTESHAADWKSLWQRADQQAEALYKDGDKEAAASLFKDPKWRAAAAHDLGDYESAVADLDGFTDPESLYNKGNSLARLGRFDEAIAAYDAVLEQAPQHEDARFNRDLLIEQQEQQEQQQQQEKSEESQQENDQSQQQNDESQSSEPEPSESDEQSENESGQDRSESDQESEQQPQQQQADQPNEEINEEDQASEQWLRSIPDDPGGLLRRKFYYQSRQREQRNMDGEKTW